MARNFTPVATEFQINTQAAGNQDDADIALMSDGRFAVVFESAGNIRLQYVTSGGVRDGSVINVESDAGSQIDPVVTSFGAGSLVLWHDVAAGDQIRYQTVSSAGALGPEQLLLQGVLALPDAVALADGRVLAVAVRNGGNINVRFIESNGVAGNGDQIDTGAGTQTDPALAAFGNQAVVIYNDQASGAIVSRFYDGVGEFGSDFGPKVTLSNGGSPTDPDVAALSDGRYIAVWDNTVTDDIEGRLIDASGNAIGSVFTISNLAGNNDVPRVAGLPDGSFIVMWENNGGLFPTEDAANDAIVAQRFDANGKPAGDLFLVNAGDPLTHQRNPAIAADRDSGEALAAWDDFHVYAAPDDNAPSGVRGHAFKATVDPIDGTDDDDTLTTYGLGEFVRGLDGDDEIHAGGGDDVVVGGKGNDNLFGEDGKDTFRFDSLKGSDTLDWEDGERLEFEHGAFKKAGKPGELKGKYFNKGSKADDGNDVFIYQKSKGKLVDENGDKHGKQTLIAKLDKGSDLDASEIFIV